MTSYLPPPPLVGDLHPRRENPLVIYTFILKNVTQYDVCYLLIITDLLSTRMTHRWSSRFSIQYSFFTSIPDSAMFDLVSLGRLSIKHVPLVTMPNLTRSSLLTLFYIFNTSLDYISRLVSVIVGGMIILHKLWSLNDDIIGRRRLTV